MTLLTVLSIYFVGGYIFSRWFVNSFLENGHWGDGRKVDAIDAVAIHIASPIMAFVLFILLGAMWLSDHAGRTGETIRRFYGVK